MDTVMYIDESGRELREVTRERAHKEGLLHRVVAVYVFNEKGDILVQERVDNGLLDHSAAGHVDPGETSLKAAVRELSEELGMLAMPLEEIGTVVSEEREPEENIHKRHLFTVYRTIGIPGKLQKSEVKSVYFEAPGAVFKKIKSDSLHRVYTKGFETTLGLLLEAKNRRTK